MARCVCRGGSLYPPVYENITRAVNRRWRAEKEGRKGVEKKGSDWVDRGVWVSRYLGFQTPGFPNVWVSKYPGDWAARYLRRLSISGYQLFIAN